MEVVVYFAVGAFLAGYETLTGMHHPGVYGVVLLCGVFGMVALRHVRRNGKGWAASGAAVGLVASLTLPAVQFIVVAGLLGLVLMVADDVARRAG